MENGGHNQEDTGEEPVRSSLGRIWVTAAELVISLDTADQPKYCYDGITQHSNRIEIGGHKDGNLIDASETLSQWEDTCRCQHTQYR